MADTDKLQGCVIISDEKLSYGVVELLAYRVRKRVELIYYAHPYEIDISRHRFVIVFSLKDLALVVKMFVIKSAPVPLIIHIDEPDILNQIDYVTQFPGIKIAPIEQSNLADKHGTLKIMLFQEIIESLTLSGASETHKKRVVRRNGAADRVVGITGDGSSNTC